MNKFGLSIKKYIPTFLSIVGGAGVITTTVLAIRATPKAMKIIQKEKDSRRVEYNEEFYADNEVYKTVSYKDDEPLTVLETIQLTWKEYIPTLTSMSITLMCIFGSNYLNKKTQTSILYAYTLLSNSYREYIQASENVFGDQAKKIKEFIATHKSDPYIFHNSDTELFFDYQTGEYFDANYKDVIRAENQLNQELAASGFVSINTFYKFIGIKPLEGYDNLGWDDRGHYHDIVFQHEKTVFDDGLECWIITANDGILDYSPYVI